MWHTAVWKNFDYEYDDGRHKVPVAQSCNLRYSKKAAFRSIFLPSGGLRVAPAMLSGSQQNYWNTADTNTGISQDTPVDGRHKLIRCHGRGARSVGISGADRILAFNMSVPFSILTGRRYARDTLLDH